MADFKQIVFQEIPYGATAIELETGKRVSTAGGSISGDREMIDLLVRMKPVDKSLQQYITDEAKKRR